MNSFIPLSYKIRQKNWTAAHVFWLQDLDIIHVYESMLLKVRLSLEVLTTAMFYGKHCCSDLIFKLSRYMVWLTAYPVVISDKACVDGKIKGLCVLCSWKSHRKWKKRKLEKEIVNFDNPTDRILSLNVKFYIRQYSTSLSDKLDSIS